MLKLKTKVDQAGASFFVVLSFSVSKAKKMVKRLAVKRIIKASFES